MKWNQKLLAAAAVMLLASSAVAERQGKGSAGWREQPYRFGTLNLLGDEVALMHVDAYAPVRGPASKSCKIKIAFVSEEVVLQEGEFTISPNRTVDTAFYGAPSVVFEVHPVITPVGGCNLDIVPVLQVQERVQAGTGKTRYVYPGQFSVPLRRYGDIGSAP